MDASELALPEKGSVASEADRIRARSQVIELTILDTESLSNVVRLRGRRIVSIQMPAGWDAASLTFRSGSDPVDAAGSGLLDVYDDQPVPAEVTIPTAASRVTCVTGQNADALSSLDYLQIRSGTAGSPVPQTADRTLFLLLK